ncbi:MAG TPA: glycosyltransferase family 2 protein [Thermoanaerobaculia bacterium]|nr:glycosyltransferase family 2 protein [Thermoanaerobaculia bacterium]
MELRRLVVVIPALDAAATVGPIVESVISVAADVSKRSPLEISVVVVDDGSTDPTAAVAEKAGAVVLRHPRNRGKGGALKTGFHYGLDHQCDAVVTLDADGQHIPAEIPKLIDAARDQEADLVLGSRGHLFPGMVSRRRNANRFSAWAISKAAGRRIDDSQTGFRLYSSRLLRDVPIRAEGFDAESEIIVRAGRRGYRIAMIPINLGFVDGLSTSHYRAVRDTIRIAFTVVRTWVVE